MTSSDITKMAFVLYLFIGTANLSATLILLEEIKRRDEHKWQQISFQRGDNERRLSQGQFLEFILLRKYRALSTRKARLLGSIVF
jgi:hypothetical protein